MLHKPVDKNPSIMLRPQTMIEHLIHIGVVFHIISMAGLIVFGCHRLWLVFCWLRSTGDPPARTAVPGEAPRVTIQIPLYNEQSVAGRIIDAVAGISWPSDRLDIQVLDDSTDETRHIVDGRAGYWSKQGRSIRVIRRRCRAGFKAGALANGLRHAKGEFIAIFDADFVPPADFLEKTMPYFARPETGMVQTRWGFLNAGYSWLTRIQAMLLTPHFGMEHQVRWSRSLFFNFNGTAGIWRKAAIEAAGGWQADTVTEDLDISYRAQLAGWRFVYVNDVVVPSELPVFLSDFRSQQQRWSKGSIQTARKILPLICKSRVPVTVKLEAFAHLLANLCWLFGFFAMLTLFPLILCRTGIGPYQIIRIDIPVFLFSGGAFLIYYLVYILSSGQNGALRYLLLLPALSIGLAPSLSLAVVSGLFSTGGYFNRTPKLGIREKSHHLKIAFTGKRTGAAVSLMNLVLLMYTFAPIGLAVHRETWLAIPFLFLFPSGFLLIIGSSLRESLFSRIRID